MCLILYQLHHPIVWSTAVSPHPEGWSSPPPFHITLSGPALQAHAGHSMNQVATIQERTVWRWNMTIHAARLGLAQSAYNRVTDNYGGRPSWNLNNWQSLELKTWVKRTADWRLGSRAFAQLSPFPRLPGPLPTWQNFWSLLKQANECLVSQTMPSLLQQQHMKSRASAKRKCASKM